MLRKSTGVAIGVKLGSKPESEFKMRPWQRVRSPSPAPAWSRSRKRVGTREL